MSRAGSYDPLSIAIIETIAAAKCSTVEAIGRELRERHNLHVSRSTLYHHIAELVDAQVLFRIKRELSLGLTWVDRLVRLAGELSSFREAKLPLLNLPSREGQERRYHAPSLSVLDSIWNNIHLELGLHHGENVWYGYNSHAWYAAGMIETERRLQESLVANGFQYHLLIGNQYFLDRLATEQLKVSGYTTVLDKCSALDSEGHAAWAGNNFTIECRFPAGLAAEFGRFFQNVRSEEEFDRKSFENLFHTRAPCTLQVRRSKKRARALREVLQPHFEA